MKSHARRPRRSSARVSHALTAIRSVYATSFSAREMENSARNSAAIGTASAATTVLLVVITEQGENRNQCEEQRNLFGFPHGGRRCRLRFSLGWPALPSIGSVRSWDRQHRRRPCQHLAPAQGRHKNSPNTERAPGV